MSLTILNKGWIKEHPSLIKRTTSKESNSISTFLNFFRCASSIPTRMKLSSAIRTEEGPNLEANPRKKSAPLVSKNAPWSNCIIKKSKNWILPSLLLSCGREPDRSEAKGPQFRWAHWTHIIMLLIMCTQH